MINATLILISSLGFVLLGDFLANKNTVEKVCHFSIGLSNAESYRLPFGTQKGIV